MNQPDHPQSSEAAEYEDTADNALIPQVSMMLRALMASPVRYTLFLLAALLVIVVSATAWGQIRLNSWNKPFYDALSHQDLREFVHQIMVFG
ncbi:MAG: ABC transporter ATP-binding protein/permease, partial [Proteobacteria bacterium]|nr:ABC transporter ATP-binding protein/permease [Pseudomonadota bacterium]